MAAIVEQVTVTKLVDIPAFAVYDGTGIPMIDEAMAAFDGAPLPDDLPAQMLDHCADNMKRLGTERELKEFLTTGKSNRRPMCYARMVIPRAGKESEIPNFKGSYLGRFPLVSADFWTSDHLSERPRSVDAFSGTRARGTLTLKRR